LPPRRRSLASAALWWGCAVVLLGIAFLDARGPHGHLDRFRVLIGLLFAVMGLLFWMVPRSTENPRP